jgi:Carbon starvation protein CstA
MGYLPGTMWIIFGVIFAGAVQDMVVLFFSLRRNGRSLGQLARDVQRLKSACSRTRRPQLGARSTAWTTPSRVLEMAYSRPGTQLIMALS